MNNVELSIYELELAAIIGVKRRIQSKRVLGLKDRGFIRFGWDIDIEGAAGELAAAKFLGLHWGMSVNTVKDSDILNTNLEVRTSRYQNARLKIKPDEVNDRLMILMVGGDGLYEAKGWLKASDGKKEIWKTTDTDKPVVYLVPQENLNPFPITEKYILNER